MKINTYRLFTAACLGASLVAGAAAFTGCAGDKYNRSTGEYIDDKSLDVRVKSALGDNPEYKFGDVNVTAYRGTVQLSGFVNTSDQKSRAGQIAKGVEGVKEVQNNISVKE